MSRIAVVGGHGQVARHLLIDLRRSEHDPVALVRREEYREELEALGAEVRLLDIEREDADAFAAAFADCDAVVFAAGGGPDGNIERKRTVDLEGSLKSIEGARAAGISRFVQISAIGVDEPLPGRHGRGVARVRRGQARRRRRAARQRSGLDDPAARPADRRPGHRAGDPGPDVAARRSHGPTSPRSSPPCSTSRAASRSSGTWSAARPRLREAVRSQSSSPSAE